MIRRLFNRLAARWLNRAAQEQRISDRERFKATARQIRAELGLPTLEIIE